MSRGLVVGAVATLVLAIAIVPSSSLAVSQAGGIVDSFGAGAREEGLGNVSALSRGGPFAVHDNPATIVLGRPLAVGATRSQLAKGFADDVWIGHLGASARRGNWGFGVTYARLDQGEQIATDESGNVLASFESYETGLEIGVAYDLAPILGTDPRRISASFGMGLKRIHVDLAPALFTASGTESEATAYTADLGFVVRRGFLFHPDTSGNGHPSRLGIRVAAAMDDVLGAELDFGSDKDPIQRNLHFGIALEGSFLPYSEDLALVEFDLFVERLESLVEEDDTAITKVGLELVAAGVASLRVAHVDDEEGAIQAPSMGVGLGLEWAGLPLGSRFDWAHRPQSSGFPRVDIFSLTLSGELFQ